MTQVTYDAFVGMPLEVPLGSIEEREDIFSSLSPFHVAPSYKVVYPPVVIAALSELYSEYNAAFSPLVAKNREWASDYRFCMADDGSPCNWGVQIDMVSLPQAFLDAIAHMPVDAVRELLRTCVFEIENSLAMYQLLEKLFRTRESADSRFKVRFRKTLDALRKRFGMPIALLAVTDQKYDAMKESEFGKTNGLKPSESEVRKLSGFDAFWGPEDFIRHVDSTRGGCNVLLYARTSDPVALLKDPSFRVEHPLLSDQRLRRIIKAHTLTMNIDAPDMDYERRINDTKEYLVPMRMGVPGHFVTDVSQPHFLHQLSSIGIPMDELESKETCLRAKPMKGTYGCYGHVAGKLLKPGGDAAKKMRRLWSSRGGHYVFQREMPPCHVIDIDSNSRYTAIDRNFFTIIDDKPGFLGGYRSLMPEESDEAHNGRNHGNAATIWAEIHD